MAKLKKDIGLLEVFSISAGAMISSGLFILPAIAFAKAGSSMIFSYLLASITILPTILSQAELVTAMPKTGGIYFFTDRSMGPLMGTVGGLTDWIALTFKTAFSLLAMGIFVIIIYPEASDMLIKTIAIVSCILFSAINIRGVKIAGKYQTIIVMLLILLLILYILFGIQHIEPDNYNDITSFKIIPVISTAGLIFISFAGTTKITAIAGEVKQPAHILPLGMLLSWGVVSTLYILTITVTIGVTNPEELAHSLTPLSLGGEAIMQKTGLVLMSIAAILAFVSTGNAGTLAASRDPMAMSKDELLPYAFQKISKYGTPWVAVIATSSLMIVMLLLLDLENFAKTASALMLLLFIVANMAVIFMRESNIKHYHPRYKAPFYPWIQIAAIVSYIFLLAEMGSVPLIFVSVFIIIALLWYYIYANGKIKREYALLNIVERITGIKTNDNLLDEELREIIIERDNVTKERFIKQMSKCPIIDLRNSVTSDEILDIVSFALAMQLEKSPKQLYKLLKKVERKPSKKIDSGVAILSATIKGKEKFEFVFVRDLEGITFSNNIIPVHAAVIIIHSSDEWFYHLHSLTWIVEIIHNNDFISKWVSAESKKEMRQIILNLPEVKEFKIETPGIIKRVFMTHKRLKEIRKRR